MIITGIELIDTKISYYIWKCSMTKVNNDYNDRFELKELYHYLGAKNVLVDKNGTEVLHGGCGCHEPKRITGKMFMHRDFFWNHNLKLFHKQKNYGLYTKPIVYDDPNYYRLELYWWQQDYQP